MHSQPLIFTWALAALVVPATAFWRLPCKGNLVVQRADPIVSPGQLSTHVHTIMGGNGFGFEMDLNSTQASTCSSCSVKEDSSNYWIPTLYYHAKNGSFISVKQSGGVIYYLQRDDKMDPEYENGLLAFPEGFRIMAGDMNLRNYSDTPEQKAISYACLGVSGEETPHFPKNNCPGGVRAQVFFPSCWDGQSFTLEDQSKHLAYPSQVNAGHCSAPFNKRLVSIFYEVVFETQKFASMWYDGKQPFVWSTGDDTGYGLHGDFVNGWDVTTLQKAVTECTADSGEIELCQHFTFYKNEESSNCKIPISVHEQTEGVLSELPGCNKVTSGPEPAPPNEVCDGAPTTIGEPIMPFTNVKELGWKYLGCGLDPGGQPRALKDEKEDMADLTIEKCIAHCQGKGFSHAGVEFAKECYCSNSILAGRMPDQMNNGYACSMPCVGDSKQICGGAGLVSIYQKCADGSNCDDVALPFINGSHVAGKMPTVGGGSKPAGNRSTSMPSRPKTSGAATNMPVKLPYYRTREARRRRQQQGSRTFA